MSGINITPSSRRLLDLSIGKRDLKRISSADDLQQAMNVSLLTRIKDWFRGTDTKQVCKDLFILFHPHDSGQDPSGLETLHQKTQAMIRLSRSIVPDKGDALQIKTVEQAGDTIHVNFAIEGLELDFTPVTVKRNSLSTHAIPECYQLVAAGEASDKENELVAEYNRIVNNTFTSHIQFDDPLYNRIFIMPREEYQELLEQSQNLTSLEPASSSQVPVEDSVNGTEVTPVSYVKLEPRENLERFAVGVVNGLKIEQADPVLMDQGEKGGWLQQLLQTSCDEHKIGLKLENYQETHQGDLGYGLEELTFTAEVELSEPFTCKTQKLSCQGRIVKRQEERYSPSCYFSDHCRLTFS